MLIVIIVCLSLLYSPFYGEDFSFEVPRDFQFLSFYVYDSDCYGLLRDSKLGKVCNLSSSYQWGSHHAVGSV